MPKERPFAAPEPPAWRCASGIDWFELHAEVDYDGAADPLPELLAALRRGDNLVPLGDGTFGVLPEEWLERSPRSSDSARKRGGHLRFERSQAGLLDALLAAQPEVAHRRDLRTACRAQLRGLRTASARRRSRPASSGRLRDYQREGLGWMEFLREFGFGGCLADDMGVGKTAQVLALLEMRRTSGAGPSLVVVPRSLMFNWSAGSRPVHAAICGCWITPGTARDAGSHRTVRPGADHLRNARRDAPQLAGDRVRLRASWTRPRPSRTPTASAKAVRLLRGPHRLALSGTPVENHLGELWTLFEFLNPGMLGESKVFKLGGRPGANPGARGASAARARAAAVHSAPHQGAGGAGAAGEDRADHLLRTGAGRSAQLYDELREHYREQSARASATATAWGESKMQVLEALLRLRQAACHPGLIDPSALDGAERQARCAAGSTSANCARRATKRWSSRSSPACWRSFASALDAGRCRYEYLDGTTRDRQAHVERFQTDPDCRLFLISLKAGGVGLNLTAAEYVFLLDPWWNPAVEAQAIDRAHRIGQTRPVFAYRLIARDTVEEKVLELQKTKRDLADAILGDDNSLIRDLKREDLELLLS